MGPHQGLDVFTASWKRTHSRVASPAEDGVWLVVVVMERRYLTPVTSLSSEVFQGFLVASESLGMVATVVQVSIDR